MTKDEFIQQYCKGSGWTLENFNENRVALPCSCGAEYCRGWAAIDNNPKAIAHHEKFNGGEI